MKTILFSAGKSYRRAAVLALAGLVLLAAGPGVALADENYTHGQSLYRKGQYAQALDKFTKSAEADPKNPTKLFYVGLCLTQLQRYKDAREFFEKAGQLNDAQPAPDKSLADKIRNNITVITRAQMQSNGNAEKAEEVTRKSARSGKDNYLSLAITSGKVVHWDTAKMPLKVYITDGSKIPGWNPGMKALVQNAMNAWQGASSNKVRFITTSSKERADITVHWADHLEHNKVGLTPFRSFGNSIVSADILVAIHYPNPPHRLMSAPAVQSTIIHELGHALGMHGHSPYPEDLMYWSLNPKQAGVLTARDRNTVRMLYSLEADVQNTGKMSTSSKQKYYTLMDAAVKHQKKGEHGKAISLYREAVRINPNDPDLYANLGLALMQSGDAANAILAYRRAISMDRRRVDAKYNLGVLLIDEGVRSVKRNNRVQAQRNFQEAVGLYEQVMQSPNHPAGTRENLEIARKNLSLLSR